MSRAGGVLAIVGGIVAMVAGMAMNLPHAQPMPPSLSGGFGLFLAFAIAQVIGGMLLVFERYAVWPTALLAAGGVTVGIASFESRGFMPVTVVLLAAQLLAIGLVVYTQAPMPSLRRLAAWSLLPLAPIVLGITMFAATPPLPQRIPEVIGVIASVARDGDRERFTLVDGTTVAFDADRAERLFAGGGIDEGLLLYGIHEGEPWFAILGTYRGGACFELEDTATDMDTHVLLDSGVLLPKAPEFQRYDDFFSDRYEDLAQVGFTPFCLNERGEVTDYLSLTNPRR